MTILRALYEMMVLMPRLDRSESACSRKMTTPKHDTGALYRSLWGKTNLRKVSQEEREKRHENATEIANAFYDLVTDHYQSGWAARFHFCGFAPHESWECAQARHEHHLALMTGIKPGMKVLDVGCGIGCPMREIAIFTGAHVTGININRMHLERAKRYSRGWWKLTDEVEFVHGDFMKMPFADDSFDVVYAMEALCHAPSMAGVYNEIKRVLKPGGYFAFYEHIMTPKYDDDNPEHREIRSTIEYGAGVPNYSDARTVVKTLKATGWNVLHDEDRALAKVNSVPWWYPLAGDMRYPEVWMDRVRTFMMKEWVYSILWWRSKILHALGLEHPGCMEALNAVSKCVFGMRDGGRLGTFTPLHLFVCRKPPEKKNA